MENHRHTDPLKIVEMRYCQADKAFELADRAIDEAETRLMRSGRLSEPSYRMDRYDPTPSEEQLAWRRQAGLEPYDQAPRAAHAERREALDAVIVTPAKTIGGIAVKLNLIYVLTQDGLSEPSGRADPFHPGRRRGACH